VKACTRHALAVVHDSAWDEAATPSHVRKLAALELCGAALCRPHGAERRAFLRQRLQQLRRHTLRVRGLIRALRARRYCVDTTKEPGLGDLLLELDEVFDEEKWELVFTAVEEEASQLADWVPRPQRIILDEHLKASFGHRSEAVAAAGPLCELVGWGAEGTVFRQGEVAWKVFRDRVPDSLAHMASGNLGEGHPLGGAVVVSPRVLRRPFVAGAPYRGGHGAALVKMLCLWRRHRLVFRNVKPDNIVVAADGHLHVVDFGRDWAPFSESGFRSMCERAFLCWRFGPWSETAEGKQQLQLLMRRQSESEARQVPELSGFEAFWRRLHSDQGAAALCTRFDPAVRVVDIEEFHGHDYPAIGGRVAVRVRGPTRRIALQRRRFRREGFAIVDQVVIKGFDEERFEATVLATDFVLSRSEDGPGPCSLLIKSCPAEHRTIAASVRQLVSSLERTSCFEEVLLLADHSRKAGFLRQYAAADEEAYASALAEVQAEGLVDRVLEFGGGPEASNSFWSETARKLNQKYLGLGGAATHSEHGSQHTSTFFGLDQVRTPIVLQTDSDILINTARGSHDLVADAVGLFSRDKKAITVTAMPVFTWGHVAGDEPQPAPGARGRRQALAPQHSAFERVNEHGCPFRFEVRCSFLHLGRLRDLLPLRVGDGEAADLRGEAGIRCGWYRLLDAAILRSGLASYRHCGVPASYPFFVHPQNDVKKDVAALMLAMDRVCTTVPSRRMAVWEEQRGEVDLVGPLQRWFAERTEWLTFVICGRNVPYGRAARCLRSLAAQRGAETCGVILLDDASGCPHTRELLFALAGELFAEDRLTLISTGVRLGYLRNTEHCVRRVMANPSSIAVTLDLDDFLFAQPEPEPSVVERLLRIYFGPVLELAAVAAAFTDAARPGSRGRLPRRLADCAVGGMLRTCKWKGYPLVVDGARDHPSAGNMWQHLRSFAKEMFDSIEPGDLLGADGQHLCTDGTAGSDWTFMVPIAEQAGSSRTHHIQGALYCYEESPCDRAVKHRGLAATGAVLRARLGARSRPDSCVLPLQLCSARLRLHVEQVGASSGGSLAGGTEVVLVVKGCSTAGSRAAPVHVRLHSECFTGDVLGSLRCDCRAQKDRFLELMDEVDDAVLVYIKGHEGRGNGLVPKVRAYASMDGDPSLHHVAALEQQGLKSDCRSYQAAIDVMLRRLCIQDVVLHTNSPEKTTAMVAALGREHVRVEPMEALPTRHNAKYLREKQRDMGHRSLLGLCLTPDQVSRLLKDLGIPDRPGEGTASLELLRRILAAVLEFVPFQNLSLLLGSQASDHAEGVLTGVGGLCFASNPLLCGLLQEFGFDAALLPATTQQALRSQETGQTPKPDHVAIVVRGLEDKVGEPRDFWVDVGNGRPYFEPAALPTDAGAGAAVVEHAFMEYRVVLAKHGTARAAPRYEVQHRRPRRGEWEWRPNYAFSAEPVSASFVEVLRRYHESSATLSPFRRSLRVNRWCGQRGHGYVLRDRIATEVSPAGDISEQELNSDDELREWVEQRFPPQLAAQMEPALAAWRGRSS